MPRRSQSEGVRPRNAPDDAPGRHEPDSCRVRRSFAADPPSAPCSGPGFALPLYRIRTGSAAIRGRFWAWNARRSHIAGASPAPMSHTVTMTVPSVSTETPIALVGGRDGPSRPFRG